MATAEIQKKYTAADLLAMPDGDHYELVDGQLVEKQMSTWASYVTGKLQRLLGNFSEANQSGWVLSEGEGYQCFANDPNRVRRPDVSFIRRGRLSLEQALTEGYNSVVPDLIVEVLSPNDLIYKVHKKVQQWLQAGVRLAWVVNPETRTVEVHRLQGAGTILREEGFLEGEDVLPGFRCAVRELFEPPAGVVAHA
jgi:Uma2 family endonuclease